MTNATPVETLSQQRAAQDRNAILKIVDNIETVIVGKREVVEIVVLAMIGILGYDQIKNMIDKIAWAISRRKGE